MKKVALTVVAVALVSCGTTLAQKANVTNEATRKVRAYAGPQLNKACKAAAVKCKKEGVEKEKCAALTKCRKVRDGFYAAVQGIHLSIAMYKVKKAAGEPTDLASLLSAGQRALDEAVSIAVQSGYLDAPLLSGAKKQ